jgi:23S rRNA (adenine2503-C2)-methyltransferase
MGLESLATSIPGARADRAGAFGLRPLDLRALGLGDHAESVFSRLQRPWLWDESGPALSRRDRALLEPIGLHVPRIASALDSADGATKLTVELGSDLVECVHMPRAIGDGRVTLCLSSQVGCAMACAFCATAAMGLRRQLAAGEIVAQVLAVLRALGPRQPSDLTLVFMGMGEPLHGLAQVARAIEVLCAPRGLGLPPLRITVSTAGLVPRIAELGALAVRPLLAVSLNATTDALRRSLMPVAARHSLAQLGAALAAYPVRRRERITIEYVLLDGVNDTPADAERLADFGAPFPHHINLIPYNAHAHAPFRAPSQPRIDAFARSILERRRTLVTVRRSRGSDVGAACGQLVVGER